MPDAAREASDSFVQVSGGRLFTRALGRGRTLIAVHGGPDFDHEYFRPELDILADAVRLVYYDQRGRGRSFDGDVPDVTIASEVADLDSVRVSVDADRVDVLGHSWGALVALEYASAHPDRVARLVLLNPAPISAEGREALRLELARRRTPEEAARLRALRGDARLGQGDLALDAEYYRIHFRPTVPAHRLDELVARLRRAFTPQGVAAARAIEDELYDQTWDLPGYALLARLGEIDVPTVVVGSSDDFVPPAIMTGIAGGLPNAELVVLEGCGHFSFMEQPEGVAQLVLGTSRRGP